MNITPREHQIAGRDTARVRPRYGFGDKPGCGKTIMSCLILDERRIKTVVLCPKSILRCAWLQDIQHFPGLRPVVVHGSTPATRSKVIESPEWDVAITTYEVWRRHREDFWKAGVRRLVVDEASKARNPETKLAKALHAESDRMVEIYQLSGTFAPNDHTEYWSAIRTMAGRSYMSYWQFCYRFGYPVKRIVNTPKGKREIIAKWLQTDAQKIALQEELRNWFRFVRKEDCLDLPPTTDVTIEVELSKEEQEAYRSAQDELRIADAKIAPAAQLMKLRQITGGSVKVEGFDISVGSSKIEALADLLDELGPDEPVVVFAEFTREIHIIESVLQHLGQTYAIIDGKTSVNAGLNAAMFQDGKLRALICHPAAAAHGITLTRACYAIYYSMSFSAELYEQSRGRIDRFGQTRPCTYYHLIATVDPSRSNPKGQTVDSRCLLVSQKKMDAAAALEMEVEAARRK